MVANSSKIIPESSTYLGIDPFIDNSKNLKFLELQRPYHLLIILLIIFCTMQV